MSTDSAVLPVRVTSEARPAQSQRLEEKSVTRAENELSVGWVENWVMWSSAGCGGVVEETLIGSSQRKVNGE